MKICFGFLVDAEVRCTKVPQCLSDQYKRYSGYLKYCTTTYLLKKAGFEKSQAECQELLDTFDNIALILISGKKWINS